jgi:hypothetical protein
MFRKYGKIIKSRRIMHLRKRRKQIRSRKFGKKIKKSRK